MVIWWILAWRKQDQKQKKIMEKTLPKVQGRDEECGFVTAKQATWENCFRYKYVAVHTLFIQWVRALWEGEDNALPVLASFGISPSHL